MRKAVETTCLTMVLAMGILTVLGSSSRAEAQVNVNIVVNKVQKTIQFTPKYLGLCGYKKGPNCDDDQFKWRLVGTLQPGETLTIEDAPGHASCFSPASIPFQLTNNTGGPMANVGHDSGPPLAACTQDEYGTYWPYVVKLTLADATEIVSDPGGIIHP